MQDIFNIFMFPPSQNSMYITGVPGELWFMQAGWRKAGHCGS